MNNHVIINKFTDYRPIDGTKYFTLPQQDGCISVIIPFFNEEKQELQVTMKSLIENFYYLGEMKPEWKDANKLKIFIVQDGWYKSSNSMKQYLKELFPKKINDVDWWEYYKEFHTYDEKTDGTATYIFENTLPICINKEERKRKHIFCNVTLLIKIDNRKKHNSHEWFIGRSGYSEHIKAKYIFCTDAFTIFHKTCLYHLINHMDRNPKTSVCTGRQRVMTRKQQRTTENFFSLDTILRNVQLFDFETSNVLYNGAFSLGGCLPVIPGPCGLYRASDLLQNNVRDWYFDIVNEEPSNTGLVLGNLRIAEDRILSYSVVLKTQEERKMEFIPMAVFYFEAETNLQQFLLQRRRWINGSVAGYLYLLFTNFEHIKQWDTNYIRKFYVWFLLICQFITYCLVAIGPAFSLSIFYYSFQYVFYRIPNQYMSIETMTTLATSLAWILFISNMFVHNNDKFHYTIIYSILGFSIFTAILTALSMGFYVFAQPSISSFFLNDLLLSGNLIIYFVLFVTVLPFVLALMISGRGHSFFYMLKSFPSYFLCSHMLISGFGSYSFSRSWDLTWGNRPTSELEASISVEEREQMKLKFKILSKALVLTLISINLIVFFLPKNFQLALVGLFFMVAFYQLFFSFIYLSFQFPSKIRYVFDRCCYNCRQVLHKNKKVKKPKAIEMPKIDIENQIENESIIELR